MRKIILYLQISLDGVVSSPEEWMLFNDEILEEAIEYYKTLDTVMLGSNTYPSMAKYWQEAEESSNSDIEKDFAKKINQINKIVLSRSSINLFWNNSKLLNYTDSESLIELINQLKNQKGKNISVESGIGTWKLFLENSLFDELILYVHPVIAGKGEKLFAGIDNKTILNLKSSKNYKNGVLELHYEKN